MVNIFISIFLAGISLSTTIKNDYMLVQDSTDNYSSFNICDFKWSRTNLKDLRQVSIIKYSISNDLNLKHLPIASFFLIASQRDTFNVINIYNGKISDSLILEYRWSNNWNFNHEKIRCVDFYSKSNLKKEINYKYPLIYGLLYAEFD
jgi:hypothetical protein